MVEVSLTIGKLDASLALLLTKDHHLIEFPTILLPDGVIAGSVVKIRCDRDLELEETQKNEFNAVQDEILHTFGEKLPSTPVLKICNTTQTSCVLEWDRLELATSTIKSLNLYKDGVRLGQIPNPLQNTTTKLSGLPVDTEFKFQLKLSTTAGIFKSNEVVVKTHKMTDLSGITVCIGEIDDPNITREKIEESLSKMNAKPLQDKVAVDTTHFICTKPSGREWKKALDSNIPIVRPEWLKACELERRIIGVRMFYLGAEEDVLKQRDYWGTGEKALPQQPEDEAAAAPATVEETQPEAAAPVEAASAEEETAADEATAPAVAETETVAEDATAPAATEDASQEAPSNEIVEAAEEAEAIGDVAITEEPIQGEDGPVEAAEASAAEVAPPPAESPERDLTSEAVPAPVEELSVPEPAVVADEPVADEPKCEESTAAAASTIDESKLDDIPLDSKDDLAISANGKEPEAPPQETETEAIAAEDDVEEAEESPEAETEEAESTVSPATTSANNNSNKNKKKKNKKNKKK